MFARSKATLEESSHQIKPDLPYFNAPRTLTHVRSQTHLRTQMQDLSGEPIRGQPLSRNAILKELRQQYQILKSLPVEDTLGAYGSAQIQQDKSRLSQSSFSSSMRSQKASVLRESGGHSARVSIKELQAVHLEKKQLQIVIGNSMRKIDELLSNEIILKKTIHELKNQIEGKGGVHQEYEKTIKAMHKNQEELQQQLNATLKENDKNVQRIKEQADKNRILQTQIANKDRQIKQAFEEQRRLHQQIRAEKDRAMNLEVQCRSFKVELDLLEKEKNSQVNRLLRQFQGKESGNEKQMTYLIKKLEDQIKQKDHRFHELLREKEQFRRELDSQSIERRDKSYLSELMDKSRQAKDTNNKALTQSMNLIIAKMAQLQKRNDETIKKELQALRKKTQEGKRSDTDVDLNTKITELQKALQKEEGQKAKLLKEVIRLEQMKEEQGHLYNTLEKKYKYLQEEEQQLREELQELSQVKGQLSTAFNHHATLQEQLKSYTQTISSLQKELQDQRQNAKSLIATSKQKEKKYDEEIRTLRRKIDEVEFELQKSKQEAELNLSLLRADHEAEAKRVVDDNTKLLQKLKETQQAANASKITLENQLKIKQNQLASLKSALQALKQKGQEDLLAQRQFFENKMLALENHHAAEIKKINQKFVTVTSANERLLSQLSAYASKDAEMGQLRRLLKHSTTMSSGVTHLWDIKQAEYGNINQVLTSLRTL